MSGALSPAPHAEECRPHRRGSVRARAQSLTGRPLCLSYLRYSIDVLVVQDRGMSRQRLGRADAWAIGATIVGNVENRSAATTPRSGRDGADPTAFRLGLARLHFCDFLTRQLPRGARRLTLQCHTSPRSGRSVAPVLRRPGPLARTRLTLTEQMLAPLAGFKPALSTPEGGKVGSRGPQCSTPLTIRPSGGPAKRAS